jgi:RimJ/RimL family protein N-acetyltransferase
VRPLGPEDAEAFVALRRRALIEEPLAFASSPEEDFALDLGGVRARFGAPLDATGAVTLGAFTPELTGSVGLYRQSGRKSQHKLQVWGMYVAPEQRGRGLARALLLEILRLARTVPGAEQVQLCVTLPSEAARRLYEKTGFTVFGEERRALRVGEVYVDELHMVIQL